MADRFASRFDRESDGDPMSVMANLVDVMLVFACGLITALIVQSPQLMDSITPAKQEITQGRELPEVPETAGEGGSGMESVGTVYRDPQTGKLILVGESP